MRDLDSAFVSIAPNLRGARAARRRQSAAGGFTLIELLVVIAIIAILAAMLLPVLAKSKGQAQGILCMNNSSQLQLAWRMYVDDNRDNVPSSYGNPAPWIPNTSMSWTGNARTDGQNRVNWDTASMIKLSCLWPYCKQSVGIWRCPGDQYGCVANAGPLAGQTVPRQRDYSMLSWFNSIDADSFSGSQGYTKYFKLSRVLNPGPAMTIVFVDERCDSINDGEWCSGMAGWPSQPSLWTIIDFPGCYHAGACGFAFADGHSEIHKWKDKRTTPAMG